MAAADGLALLASRLLLTPTSHAIRQQIVTRQRASATQLWPAASVTACGSFVQGTSLRASDLDLVISLPPDKTYPDTISWARRLQTLNSQHSEMMKPESSYVAKVKSMFLLHYESAAAGEDVKVDVTFQRLEPMQGRDVFLCAQLDRFAGAREALVLLKAWMCFHGFAEPYTGGIGNYGLALGLVACINFLSRTRPPVPTNAYGLVREYLRYFTDPDLPPWNGILDVRTGGIVKEQPFVSSENYLMVMDPVVERHVIGGRGFRRMELREAMKGLLEVVEREGPGMGVDKATEVFAGGDIEGAGDKRRPVVKEAIKRWKIETRERRREEGRVIAAALRGKRNGLVRRL
jgi:predicted nucleotidyltransferase